MSDASRKRMTIPELQAMKARGEKIAVLTAYDFPFAVVVAVDPMQTLAAARPELASVAGEVQAAPPLMTRLGAVGAVRSITMVVSASPTCTSSKWRGVAPRATAGAQPPTTEATGR